MSHCPRCGFDSEQVISTPERALKGEEPTHLEIKAYMDSNPGESFYSVRELLREKAYGGKPPNGCYSWGEFWKNY